MRPFIFPAIMFSILVLFLSCDKKKDGPNANFINQINFKKVQFMDLSKEGDGNIVRWEWNFGDGTTSTEEHPLHTYPGINTYAVSLAVTDENDLSDAITKEIAIPDTAVSPIVDFSPQIQAHYRILFTCIYLILIIRSIIILQSAFL